MILACMMVFSPVYQSYLQLVSVFHCKNGTVLGDKGIPLGLSLLLRADNNSPVLFMVLAYCTLVKGLFLSVM